MDACDISITLDASKDNPGPKEWPITKVAALLVGSKMENCLLLHGAANGQSVKWSWDVCKISPKGTREGFLTTKRKRISKKPLNDDQSMYATRLQQLDILAVKEVAGICLVNRQVVVLEES